MEGIGIPPGVAPEKVELNIVNEEVVVVDAGLWLLLLGEKPGEVAVGWASCPGAVTGRDLVCLG